MPRYQILTVRARIISRDGGTSSRGSGTSSDRRYLFGELVERSGDKLLDPRTYFVCGGDWEEERLEQAPPSPPVWFSVIDLSCAATGESQSSTLLIQPVTRQWWWLPIRNPPTVGNQLVNSPAVVVTDQNLTMINNQLVTIWSILQKRRVCGLSLVKPSAAAQPQRPVPVRPPPVPHRICSSSR
ncbi:hypothetical protein TIFTF001_026079 [Ficus carica]|uniref:Uncharacterized protein n=1 Tax=Ficus carica TaxID=3494 RepID=A0AA88AZE2_FICCA|nr:hypothetical protein TIFTF001_026079 [Ficus carica]